LAELLSSFKKVFIFMNQNAKIFKPEQVFTIYLLDDNLPKFESTCP